MTPRPLTARQAIEVRRKWLDAKWHRLHPQGAWRVYICQYNTVPETAYSGPARKPYTLQKRTTPANVAIVHIVTRPDQTSEGRMKSCKTFKPVPSYMCPQFWNDRKCSSTCQCRPRAMGPSRLFYDRAKALAYFTKLSKECV
jgi:hypothetical protein